MESVRPPNPHGTPLLRVLAFLIFAFLVAVLLSLGAYYFLNKEQTSIQTQSPTEFQNKFQDESNSSDNPPLLLKSIGINLDYYDQATGKAGDLLFTKQKLQFDRLFMGYGFFIPASSASEEKKNPQPTFILPLGTPVRSLVDGTVVNMPILWSKDISIQVSASDKMEKWVYETEHVTNPRVKVGDKVKAGQIIAEVSNFDKGAPEGFGAVEIGILKGGNPPHHVCPFAYLDPSIKEKIFSKIKAFYKSWEDYRGDTTLYNEEAEAIPGCLTLDLIEG